MDNKPVIIRLKKRPTIVKPKPPAIRISKRKAAVSIQIAPTQALQRFKTWVHKARLDEKPHQIEGMQWCLSHELLPMTGLARRRGGIVADEMGLGKTILMLGCIVSNFRRRTLIILPPALLSQWVKVIQDRLGHRPLVYHGAKIRKTSDEELQAAPVVVTTYGMIAARQPSKGAAWIVQRSTRTSRLLSAPTDSRGS